MITLNASGGSVTFTFSGNSTYLNDGTITVPVNSLALIIDESNMATFRKAASNDIFVSANIAEFGMTKAELESWYKANMVGSTGGGGGGITSGEVQTMIDESISGKANSSDVYTTGQTSGATEIANALNAKLDATAYTPTDLSEYWTSAQTSSAIDEATSGKTNQSDFTAYTADTTPKVDGAWANSIKSPSLYYDYTSGITLSSLPISGGNYNYSSIATDASINANNGVLGVYTTGATHAVIKNDSVTNNRALINSIPSSIKMYWNLSYTGNTSHYIAASCLVNDGTNGYCQWDWKNNQYVPNNNYINTAVTLSYDSTNQVVTITPSSSSALTSIIYVRCNRNIAPATALTQDNCKIGLVTIDTDSYKLQEALDNKQDILSAGTNITISGNVISANGVQVSSAVTSGDTNPVENQALWDELRIEGEPVETTLTFEEQYSTNYPEGCTKLKVEVVGSMNNSVMLFFNDGINIGNITINNYGSISVDTSVFQGATYEISGTTVIISYPTVQNVTKIQANNGDYVYKAVTTGAPTALKTQIVENTTALGGLKLQQISQSDYDNLPTKDSSTLYIII